MPARKKKTSRQSRPTTAIRKRPGLLRELGLLRIGLWLLALTVMLLAPKPGTPAVYAGWELIPTLMAPVLAPILFQVLLLDALMSRVWMGAHTGAARERYRRILWINLGVTALTTLWWLPYFSALARGKGMG